MAANIKAKVTSDFSSLTRLLKRMESLENHEVEYGYFAGDIHQSSGLPMAELAGLLNDGTEHIPARPFVDDAILAYDRWFDTSKEWRIDVTSYLTDAGGNIRTLYAKYGRYGVDAIKMKIDVNDYEDNDAAWKQMKLEMYGKSMPLVETDELYESGKYRVRKINEKA